jgi:FkbM family methyltransferase
MNIIEIGANDGSDTERFSDKSNVWCFEPNPHHAKSLRGRFKNNKNVKIMEKAVSDFNGNAHFNISLDGNSSSLNDLTDFAINNTKIRYVDKVLVDVIRMDTFLDKNNIKHIDYFHCDAQGDDFKILKSFGDMISIIERGKIEVSLKDELYSNTLNNLDEVTKFLIINGFEVINWGEINKNKMDIRRYDGNVIFCRKNSKSII